MIIYDIIYNHKDNITYTIIYIYDNIIYIYPEESVDLKYPGVEPPKNSSIGWAFRRKC
jgi:hypothetical protein